LEFIAVMSVVWEEGGFSMVPDDGCLIPGVAYAFAYADDVVCFCSDQAVLQSMLNWLVCKIRPFDLTVNTDKTDLMVFNPANGNGVFVLSIYNKQLKTVKVFQHLGVRIRDDLAYLCHFSQIKNKALSTAKRMGALLFRLNVTDLDRIKLYFYAFVSSQLYGLPIIPDVSEIYKTCAANFFKACFCLPTSMANCAAIFFLSPKSSFEMQIKAKVNFFRRVSLEYGESSILRIMRMDIDVLFQKRCGWGISFLNFSSCLQKSRRSFFLMKSMMR
jgi:hypothetical protein